MADVIGVLGTGHMGGGLAREAARAGRRVLVGSREIARAERVCRDVRARLPDAAVFAADHAGAADGADLVLLAVPFPATAVLLTEVGQALEGKVLVDMSNPFGALPPDRSAAEEHAGMLSAGTAVVAAFKTNFSDLLDPANRGGSAYDVHLAADDREARERVAAFVTSIGFRPVDCGPLASARVLDAMVPLLVEMDRRFGNNRRSAWAWTP